MTTLEEKKSARVAGEFIDRLRESAKAGDQDAKAMVEEHDGWLNIFFIEQVENVPVILWPPVEINAPKFDPVYATECVIGTHCALELIGHLRSHGSCYDGSRLTEVAEIIVRRGKFSGLEVGFFGTLGAFIARGKIPVSTDFDAFPCDTAGEARS